MAKNHSNIMGWGMYAGDKMTYSSKAIRWGSILAVALFLGLLLTACGGGGGGGGDDSPSITIDVPTSAPTYATAWADVRLGGSISGASFVHVHNALTGSNTEGYVNYNQGLGSWFADISGLGFGDNPITVTADADGTGTNTADAYITIVRPLQPADLILNGTNQVSAVTYWTDGSSYHGSHKIALFADGTGRSTTGSTLTEDAGGVVDITWSKTSPDSIVITGCLTCSFQAISRISGSFADAAYYGQVVTTGGLGDVSLDAFILTDGTL